MIAKAAKPQCCICLLTQAGRKQEQTAAEHKTRGVMATGYVFGTVLCIVAQGSLFQSVHLTSPLR